MNRKASSFDVLKSVGSRKNQRNAKCVERVSCTIGSSKIIGRATRTFQQSVASDSNYENKGNDNNGRYR